MSEKTKKFLLFFVLGILLFVIVFVAAFVSDEHNHEGLTNGLILLAFVCAAPSMLIVFWMLGSLALGSRTIRPGVYGISTGYCAAGLSLIAFVLFQLYT